MPPSSASAAAKRKQDEKHYNILKELLSQECNKKCFDCKQRGPVYVNMTIGAFVCTSCSGLLRGMNTPHRVKSVSMASFTPDEMEFIQKRGNDACYCIWLGRYESIYASEDFPHSKDEHKLRDFLYRKYEQKTWYVSESKALAEYEEIRKKNQAAAATAKAEANKTTVKPSIPVPLSAPKGQSLASTGKASSAATSKQDNNQSTASKSQNDLDLIFGSISTTESAVKEDKSKSQSTPGSKSITGSASFTSDPFASNATSSTGDYDLFAGFSTASNGHSAPSIIPQGLSKGAEQPFGQTTSFTADFSQLSLSPQPSQSKAVSNGQAIPVSSNPPVSKTATTVTASKEDKYAVLASLDEEIKSSSNKLSWSDTMTAPVNAPAMNHGVYTQSTGPVSYGGSNQWASQGQMPPSQYSSAGGKVDMNYNQSGGFMTSQPHNTANPFMSSTGPVPSANPFVDQKWGAFRHGNSSAFSDQTSGYGTDTGFGSFVSPGQNANMGQQGFYSSAMYGGNQFQTGGMPTSASQNMNFNPNASAYPYNAIQHQHAMTPSFNLQGQQQTSAFNPPPSFNNFTTQFPAQVSTQSHLYGMAPSDGVMSQPSSSWGAASSNQNFGDTRPDPFASLSSGFKSSGGSQWPASSASTQWGSQSSNAFQSGGFASGATTSMKANPFMD